MVSIKCGDLKLEGVELVCFDKDGTLLTPDMYIPVMEKRAKLLMQKYGLKEENHSDIVSLMGLDPETLEIVIGGAIHIERVEIIRRTREYLRTLSINSTVEDIAELFDEVDHLVDFTDHIKSIDNVQKVLEKIRDSDAKIVIVTHDSTEPAAKQLVCAGLFDYFDQILGLDIDSPYHAKPAPDMLQYACKVLNADVSKSIVIGDDDRDMLMGKNAGAMACIGVLTGKSNKEELKNADVVLDSVADMKI
ncbi:MAG: HAD family hydrolase [Candidatus Heimdallarchaeaceae archaeon]